WVPLNEFEGAWLESGLWAFNKMSFLTCGDQMSEKNQNGELGPYRNLSNKFSAVFCKNLGSQFPRSCEAG
ncbi:hypothetical protein SAY86_029131, partial [Trapa natans]